MRPRMLWLTSTLSTLSRLISNVRRLMKPVLWTTRILVTSVSVVQRWNHAFAVQYSAAIATTAEADRHTRTVGTRLLARNRAVMYTRLLARALPFPCRSHYLTCQGMHQSSWAASS